MVFWTYGTFFKWNFLGFKFFLGLGFFWFFGGWSEAGVIDSSYQEMSILRFHSFFFAKTTQMAVELAEDRQTFSDTGKSLVNWIL